MPAIRAAPAGSRAARGDVKDPRVFARDLLDAAARHRTELVHAPFYGVRCVTFQTPVPTGSIHANCGRAKSTGVLYELSASPRARRRGRRSSQAARKVTSQLDLPAAKCPSRPRPWL